MTYPGGFYMSAATRLSRSSGVALALVVAAALGSVAAIAAQYERAPTFTAREVLPSSLLNSRYYKVQNSVEVENYQYVFNVDTQWGTFRIVGTTLLRVRAREMQAATKLAEIGGAETLVDAAHDRNRARHGVDPARGLSVLERADRVFGV